MDERKKNIYLTLIFSGLFIIGFFLPVLDFSFGVTLKGYEAFIMQGVSVFSTTDYSEYLWKMLQFLTPLLDIVLILWFLRKEINSIALVIVSITVIISSSSWIIRYGDLGILRVGYYYWVLLNILIVFMNFIVNNRKRKTLKG